KARPACCRCCMRSRAQSCASAWPAALGLLRSLAAQKVRRPDTAHVRAYRGAVVQFHATCRQSRRRRPTRSSMNRRTLLALLGGAAAWPRMVHAQQSERLRRIGVLYGGSQADPQGQAGLAAFMKSLRELGWVAGRNIAIEQRFADGDTDRMRALAKELAALR